jgi:hypothetical protein
LRGLAAIGRHAPVDPHGDRPVASGEDVVGVLDGVDAANLLTPKETAR